MSVKSIEQALEPDRSGFDKDPIGYSTLAWHKWGIAQTLAGFPIDISKPPTKEELKSPILWITQAQAMAEAAKIVLQNSPSFEGTTIYTKAVLDCQYCAVGLMLVGYSLEIALKAMHIMRNGIDEYIQNESKFFHHRLAELADFIPDLTEKDKAILESLSHFTIWAGRYPDPGSGRIERSVDIFELSEFHQISAHDLFLLASTVMSHAGVAAREYE